MFYKEYLKRQRLVNTILFITLVISVFAYFFLDERFLAYLSENDLADTSNAIRNVAYLLAITLTGALSYYSVVRYRTFHPRLWISIYIKDFCGIDNDVAIIRFQVRDIGKVRVFPLRGKASFLYGTLQNDEVVFSCIGELNDLFEHYHEIDENLFLEPDDEVNIDRSFVCSDVRKEEKNEVHTLMVRSEIWAANNRAYQEIALLNISPNCGGKV